VQEIFGGKFSHSVDFTCDWSLASGGVGTGAGCSTGYRKELHLFVLPEKKGRRMV